MWLYYEGPKWGSGYGGAELPQSQPFPSHCIALPPIILSHPNRTLLCSECFPDSPTLMIFNYVLQSIEPLILPHSKQIREIVFMKVNIIIIPIILSFLKNLRLQMMLRNLVSFLQTWVKLALKDFRKSTSDSFPRNETFCLLTEFNMLYYLSVFNKCQVWMRSKKWQWIYLHICSG